MEYLETAHDYEVRFLECYGVLDDKVIFSDSFYTNDSNEVVMNYMDINRQSNKVGDLEVFKYYCTDPKQAKIPYDNDVFILPKLGFINTSFFTVFYERRHKKSSPSRYRRGLRSDTLSITNISAIELEKIMSRDYYIPPAYDLFNATVHDLFFPKYYSYEEAIESIINHKRLSTAITNTIALKYDVISNSIQLLKNNWIVGDYLEDGEGFVLRTSFYEDDLIQHNVKVLK